MLVEYLVFYHTQLALLLTHTHTQNYLICNWRFVVVGSLVLKRSPMFLGRSKQLIDSPLLTSLVHFPPKVLYNTTFVIQKFLSFA